MELAEENWKDPAVGSFSLIILGLVISMIAYLFFDSGLGVGIGLLITFAEFAGLGDSK